MSMVQSLIGVKGFISVSNTRSNKTESADKFFNFVRTVMKLYPKKFKVSYKEKRDSTVDNKMKIDEENVEVALLLTQGVIKSHNLMLATGSSVDPILGECNVCTLPFGTTNSDTGHVIILSHLPWDVSGCYKIKATMTGNIGKVSDKNIYNLRCDVEVFIKVVEDAEYSLNLKSGRCVYPLCLDHPLLYSKLYASDSEATSEAEGEGDSEEDEPNDNEQKSEKGKSYLKHLLSRVGKRGRDDSPYQLRKEKLSKTNDMYNIPNSPEYGEDASDPHKDNSV
ncbi:TPA_asm: M [Rhododendron delavayi virus 1]|uniref:M n=1 Tax=Rhododendron delavayi virus 1 TaxID=2793739 RepID=A0A8D9UIP3_9RHAB|nr:M [Rhododendron delavayi virus 1] [Rhododendron delavayi virus 1]DAF42306.1 TPA_asm: M [Rhododendron delavayi virus 1]